MKDLIFSCRVNLISQIYYMDFVALGYPPSEASQFVSAGADKPWDMDAVARARDATKGLILEQIEN